MHCGLDFGTSNSVTGIHKEGKVHLIPLENKKPILPSTIFFNYETETRHFGQEATDLYINNTEGRLLRSLKSILGSSLIQEKTKMKNSFVALEDIIKIFLEHIRNKIEDNTQKEITSLTLGRPVFFVDDNQTQDEEAQNQLEKIAKKAGFKNISFMFEPVAAANQYKQKITKEENALIIDLGGGTSDFSIINLTHGLPSKILASDGIHIGGTNIDHMLSLHKIMPLLGFQKEISENLKTPNHLYFDLSTWHRIHMLYTQKKKRIVEELKNTHPNITELNYLNEIMHYERGHDLLFRAEKAKIDLTEHEKTVITLDLLEKGLSTITTQKEFNEHLKEVSQKLWKTIQKTLQKAGLKESQINTIFLTGGTTKIPFIKDILLSPFPNAKIIDNNTFYSVAEGLTLHKDTP